LSYKHYYSRNNINAKSWFSSTSSKPEAKTSQNSPRGLDENTRLELFQYATCPFCNKVRTYLDYHSIPYVITEVCPIRKPEMKSLKVEKKKVPTIKIESEGDDSPIILQESSVIISLLHSYQSDSSRQESWKSLTDHYATITQNKDDNSANYSVKNYGLSEQDKFRRELQWRKWADEKLVHAVAPNIYRSFRESLDTFKVITDKGNYGYDAYWAKPFTFCATWLGSTFMYNIIAPRLKKKNHLKENVRESLYDYVDEWLAEVGDQKFHGGDAPNLADLAVFGVLRCMEDTEAFADMLEFTKVGPWYGRMKKLCDKNSKMKVNATKSVKEK